MPSAALSRTGSLRSMYDTNPSTSASVQAGVVDGVADGDAGQLELGLRRLAAGVVRRLADAGDDGRADASDVEDALRR